MQTSDPRPSLSPGRQPPQPLRSAPRHPSGWRWLLPALVLAAGLAYSIYLQSLITESVFFSGDGGLKALIAQQFAAGQTRFDLDLPAEPWVHEVWEAGYYPFEPPFVYTIDGRRYTQYSFLFPLVSAPPYALLGHRGLHVIPLVSAWLLWALVWIACARLRIGALGTTAALFATIFASPLTIYGATYWEHTPAVALAFLGLLGLLRPYDPPSRGRLALHGAALGLGVWFRDELYCLVGALGLVMLAATALRRPRAMDLRRSWPFFAGLAALLLVDFGIDTVVYGHPLGVHSFPVMLDLTLESRLDNAAELFRRLPAYLLDTFPLVLFTLATLILFAARDPWDWKGTEATLLAAGLLFLGSVPFVLPDISLGGDGGKQWGPRFLLILVPVGALLTTMTAARLSLARRFGARYFYWLIFLGLLGYGAWRNTVEGTRYLQLDYRWRVKPAIEYLRESEEVDISVYYQHMAHEMLPSLRHKHFFLAEGEAALAGLARELHRRGRSRFLHIVYYTQGAPEPVSFHDDEGKEHSVVFTDLGPRYGIYMLYSAAID